MAYFTTHSTTPTVESDLFTYTITTLNQHDSDVFSGNAIVSPSSEVVSLQVTASPDGLVPTLLVYGAYPKMSGLDPPTPSISEQRLSRKP